MYALCDFVRLHQRQQNQSDQQQGCERSTSQVESRRVLDRPGMSWHRLVIPRLARPAKSAHLLTPPALTHDFHFVSAQKNDKISSKARQEAPRKSKAGEFLTDQESQGIARYSPQTPCGSLARHPKSAHLLTPLALTRDFLFVSAEIRGKTRGKTEKEARRKSRAGEFLTDHESEYIARYSHQTPCCSLAFIDTSRTD